MMGRSHVFIGLAATTTMIAAGLIDVSPATLVAALIGSLAPDIDTPQSTLGRLLFFVSYPFNAAIGHRTGTHSLIALVVCMCLALVIEAAGFAGAGLAFFVGYAAHIGADLLTREGCAFLYPWDRTRYVFWPAIMTGGLGEPFAALSIVALRLATAYWLDPQTFDLLARLRHFRVRG
ncbi:metal-dependent hydrolase [Acidisoma cladoniae]|uniref:metal-dependent hydrolase n=1 Tax=Acidisoma cladoniae TaxID=3040935 RepID=UPI002549C742|nr:metal-dependent hydrolase [Acidisoma sp. PAMC 29798]